LGVQVFPSFDRNTLRVAPVATPVISESIHAYHPDSDSSAPELAPAFIVVIAVWVYFSTIYSPTSRSAGSDWLTPGSRIAIDSAPPETLYGSMNLVSHDPELTDIDRLPEILIEILGDISAI
jgi:hypothetical protein